MTTPENRVSGQDIKDLKTHIESNIEKLPELAKRFNLNQEAIDSLKAHMQGELDFLSTLPEDATLDSVMDNHFRVSTTIGKELGAKNNIRYGH